MGAKKNEVSATSSGGTLWRAAVIRPPLQGGAGKFM